MTIDHQKLFRQLDEAFQILGEPQFLVPDVCKITGATPKAIEHFVDPKRGMVHLMGDWVNPGTGKRRRFTGEQVLMIAAAYAVSRVGFPQRWSIQLAEQVANRAKGRINGLAVNTHMTLLNYPMQNGDWAFKAIYAETVEEPILPLSVLALDVDRLIDETLTQLMAIVNGEEIPDFTIPDPEPEPSPYSPKSNFFKNWEKGESGEWHYVGLTLEETRILMEDQGFALDGDELLNVEAVKNPDREYMLELRDRHEQAKWVAIGFNEGND
ncbi:hypothetical protein EOK75_14230 (plasmid) [Pseudorhodobacter turbinis]|uniref:Uncharacterized protein n=1 Tax=Pseudorhodobacter turbinis TaxID=2500533 RepID=A0A4V1E155_9RHOB|nr:hypothetical protein [Pseudorhodobacter turbinis]QCO56954.1 hypothetical protein EOK75_14230 [Pseudorhodobacter turbinis]